MRSRDDFSAQFPLAAVIQSLPDCQGQTLPAPPGHGAWARLRQGRAGTEGRPLGLPSIHRTGRIAQWMIHSRRTSFTPVTRRPVVRTAMPRSRNAPWPVCCGASAAPRCCQGCCQQDGHQGQRAAALRRSEHGHVSVSFCRGCPAVISPGSVLPCFNRRGLGVTRRSRDGRTSRAAAAAMRTMTAVRTP